MNTTEPWNEFKTAGKVNTPFPVEGAATVLAHFPHHSNSNYKIYVYGGTGRFSQFNNEKDLYELSVAVPGSAAYFLLPYWRKVETKAIEEENEDVHIPEQRAFHTMTYVPHIQKCILFGGELGSAFGKYNEAKIYELDLNDFKYTWEKLDTASETMGNSKPMKPIPRCKHSAVATNLNGDPFVYIFGGQNTVIGMELGDLWRYDPVQHLWKLLSNYPTQGFSDMEEEEEDSSRKKKRKSHPSPRYGHCMCISPDNSKLYIIGGCSKESIPCKDIWEFNLDRMVWRQLSYDCSEDQKIDEVISSSSSGSSGDSSSGSSSGDNSSSSSGGGEKKEVESLNPEGEYKEDINFSEEQKIEATEAEKDIITFDAPIQKKGRSFSLFSKPQKPMKSTAYYIPARGGCAVSFGTSLLITGGETLMENEGVDPLLNDVLIFHTKSQKLIRCGLISSKCTLMNHGMIVVYDQMLLLGGRSSWYSYNNIVSTNILKEPFYKYLIDPSCKKFGVSMETLELTEDERKIPLVLALFLDYLNEKGIDVEGVFRLSAGQSELNGWLLELEKGTPLQSIDLSMHKNPHTIIGLLKLFFKQLPDPLFTFDLLDEFVSIFKENDNLKAEDAITHLNKVIAKLPDVNRRVMRELFKYMHKVTENSEMTKMDADNIARAFGTTLSSSRNPKDDILLLQGNSPVISLISTMIKHHDKLSL